MADRQKGIYIFSILVVLLSLFVTFAPELTYSTLFLEMLVQSRPYIAVILFVCAFFFVLKRYYLLGVIQMICVLANIVFVMGAYTENQSLQLCSNSELKSIRVLSFNVYYKNEKYADIVHAIKSADADIVLLQEVQSGLYNYGHKDLLGKYTFHYSELEQGIAHGKALYSKYPIESVKKQKLVGSPHHVLQAQINIDDQIVNLIAIHTYSPKSVARIKDRNEHIKALQRYMKGIEKAGEALIVAGDFNTTPWHPIMKELKEESQLNNNSFYNIIGTWPTWLPRFLTLPIDHIFYNNYFGHSNYYKGSRSGSDHYPIYVDLQLCL